MINHRYCIDSFTQSGADTKGAIAVADTCTINGGFTVNNNDGHTSYALVVGGDLQGMSTLTSLEFFEINTNLQFQFLGGPVVSTEGDVIVGGTCSATVNFNGAGALTSHSSSLPIDFSATTAYL